jgi:dTDP-4-dehydrorhamnose reductase
MTRYQQVREMASFFSLDTSLVNCITTKELEQPAARPLISGLNTVAVERKLNWSPRSFRDCLAHLIGCSDFRCRYPELVNERG